MGLCPTPRKLFEKSLIKNFNGNAHTRIPTGYWNDYRLLPIIVGLGIYPKTPKPRECAVLLKFLVKLFSKSLWGVGQSPTVLFFNLYPTLYG